MHHYCLSDHVKNFVVPDPRNDNQENKMKECYSYTTVCPPVRGDNPLDLASGLSPVQADKPWYNYFIPPSSG